MENAYGENWYKYFFNMYHCAFMVSQIQNNDTMSKELSSKLGQEWFDKHIKSHKISDKKILYSYNSLIRSEREKKTVKKGRLMTIKDDDDNIDYKVGKKLSIKTALASKKLDRPNRLERSRSKSKKGGKISRVRVSGYQDQKDFDDLKLALTEQSSDSSDYNYSLKSQKGGNTVYDEVNQYNKYYDWTNGKYYILNTIRFKSSFGTSQNVIKFPYGERIMYNMIPDDPNINPPDDEGRLLEQKKQIGGDDDDDDNNDNDDQDQNQEEEEDQEQYEDQNEEEEDEDEKEEEFNEDELNEDQEADAESRNYKTKGNEEEKDEKKEQNEEEDEDMNMAEIEELYKHDDVLFDENTTKTSDMIKDALNDESLFKKNMRQMAEFGQEKDTSVHVEKLKNVYDKYYIRSQYIFGDDTIKIVKDKICCSIKNNKKFEDILFLAPSRQYLWGEYVYNNEIDKIMIGQKWIRRNELLDIDVEPDNRLYMYEQLKDNLGLLRHNIKKFGNKIRREDDDNNILYDYENYITNNDIYMIDVYNELGKGYKPDADTLRNLEDVYFKIYFPKLRKEDITNIIDSLNGNQKAESSKIIKIHEDINNDLVMENEIVNVVEEMKQKEGINKIFKENYITQSVIHVNLRILSGNKLDMYRIFNEFKTDDTHPYIQYQTIERGGDYKYNENEIYNYVKDKDNLEVLYKWFENAPYGISFKVKVKESKGDENEKFMSIGLNESGRIEYKTVWQETDGATIEDIKATYVYVKNLVEKINKESPRNKIIVPEDEEFKFAFINTIQKFELPEKYTINHNDLSEFSRFFYPYVALVIEPRKRQAKLPKSNDKSKFGTYLRYKKITKYENQSRLEQRIIFFMRNYEFQDNKLASELAKQFNITEEKAYEELIRVKAKYSNLKKSRKVLKKLENIPKYKPPGIGIDIQGKQREKYKIRISGARNQNQLNRIISFMNILIYLYIETYLYKKKERQVLKDKLKKLTNIAKRRSKVDELVDYTKEIKTVKQMTQIDKRRIGFKPEKGQNQWTRSCQNSGNDKKRRPQQYNTTTMDQLIKKGYVYNKKLDIYEKKFVTSKGKKKKEVYVRTIKLPEYDENGENTGNYIHYACDPEENGPHMYVGFLTRSANPFGHCMPCCFKKDPADSNNKTKKAFFESCLGKMSDDVKEVQGQKSTGDKLYILQDTNKLQEGRFGYLPKYLDRYFNFMLDKNKKINHNYLEQTVDGYFFKYGSDQSEYQFLNAVSSSLDMKINDIKNTLIKILNDDTNDQIFTSLNAGDIKTQFASRDKYIEFIKSSRYLDFELVKDVICLPGVLTKGGLNIVIFHKREIYIKKTLEKERVVEDFFIDCIDSESNNNIKNPNYSTIFMIKDSKFYYPIVLVKKEDKNSKNIDTEKIFHYSENENNIVNHISDFFNRNCSGTNNEMNFNVSNGLNAKQTANILRSIGKDYSPRYQIIDIRNKCKYIITMKGLLIPVRPSGSIWDVQIIKNFEKYINTFDDTLKYLNEIYEKSDKKLTIKPLGVYYESKSNNQIKINSIMTQTKDVVPIISETIDIDKVKQLSLNYEKKPLTDRIDDEILKGPANYKIDDRINKVKENMFIEESYQLFRLEYSNYINKPENSAHKAKITKIINSNNDKITKIDKIRLLIYKIIDKSLYHKYMELLNIKDDEHDQSEQTGGTVTNNKRYDIFSYDDSLDKYKDEFYKYVQKVNQSGGKINRFVRRLSKLNDLTDYEINNDRKVCEIHSSANECNNNPHCRWANGSCYIGLTTDMIVMFVNRISDELAQNNLKAYEILRIGEYFVSDIVDRNRFTQTPGQKIIRASSSNIKRILQYLFGKDNIPNIGKKKSSKIEDVDHTELNINNPIRDLVEYYVQKIIPNNMSILRAYSNGLYWIKNKYYDSESRNLGYYSHIQSDLANNFKALIIEWLNDSNKNAKSDLSKSDIPKDIIDFLNEQKISDDPIRDFIVRLSNDVMTTSNGIIELLVLSKIYNIPVIIRNENNKIIHILDNGSYIKPNQNAKYDYSKCINLKYEYIGNSTVPDLIEVMYFK